MLELLGCILALLGVSYFVFCDFMNHVAKKRGAPPPINENLMSKIWNGEK